MKIKVPKQMLPLAITSIFFFYSQGLLAQTSAGQILQGIQQLEPGTSVVPEAVQEVSPSAEMPVATKPEQVSFVVKHFVFTGNSRITSEDLEKEVSAYLNKPITFEDLQRALGIITDYYRSKGWLVRVLLPQQDITNGTVTIQIVEARLGGIRIDNQSKRVSSERVEKWIYDRIPQAETLSLEELDRALLTLNDLPDVSVTGSLQQGALPGETLLLLTVADKPLFNGQVSADNFGDSNSGKVRGTAQLNINGSLGIGDQISVYGMYADGTNYGRLGVSAPLGTSGLRVGVNGSAMEYRVLNNTFNSLFANGYATTGGVDATYPIIRTRPMNLVGVFYWNYNQFRNWNRGSAVVENSYDTNVTQAGLSGNLLDSFVGGGLNNASLIGSLGDVGKDAWANGGRLTGVAGSFAKLRYGFNRIQTITEGLQAYLSVSGQVASKNMDSSEQMYLGGPMNVRAYGSGQAPASQGNLTTVELRQALPYQALLTGFYDIGNVQMWKFNTPNVSYNNYALQGFGASLSWLGPYGLNLKATWAQRTGQLSQSVSNYLNQNGGTSFNRLWLTASIPF